MSLLLRRDARAQAVTPPSLTLETRAQELYQQGRAHFFAGEFEQARTAFQASLDTVDSPNTRMYLGRALQRLGRNAEAYATFDRAARDAGVRAASEPRYTPTRDSARSEAAAIAPSIAWLRVDVPSAPGDVTVSVNGHAVQRGGLGVEMPLDPGAAVVEVRARDHRDARRELSLAAGAHEAVTVTLEALPRPPEPSLLRAVTPPARQVITQPASAALRTAGITTSVVGGAALVASAVFGGITVVQYGQAQEQQNARGLADQDLTDSGTRNGYLTTGFLVGGAALLAVGAAMYLVGNRARTSPVTMTPGGVGVGGSF